MSKDEVIKALKEDGYNAYVNDGVVFVYVTKEQSLDPKFFDKMRGEFKKLNYHASWGYGVRKESDDISA